MKPCSGKTSVLIACAMMGLPVRALADAPNGDAAATALFDEGRRLMAAHRYSDACPKLADSERLAPSGGTLFNLAECYEHTGQTASAWVTWKDAAARANAAGKAQPEKAALDRAAALEPNLARLTVAVAPDSDVPDLEIKRDGLTVGRAEYGVAIPVDPGTHAIEAHARNKKAWSAQVDVAPKQADARLVVALVDEVAPTGQVPAVPGSTAASASSTQVEQPTGRDGKTQRIIGWVALGTGVIGVAVGSLAGLEAKSKNDQALQPDNCRTSTYCTANGLTLTQDAKSAATFSTIAFIVGGAALATGVVLWITAPTAGAIRVAPSVGTSFGGALLDGAF
jgi:hypothetical protein